VLQAKAIKVKIAKVHASSRGTYGSPRMTVAFNEQGEKVGRSRVARLMREAGLQGRQARRYRVRTTDSTRNDPIAPNLLAKAPAPTKPDEIWVADMTYVETGEGWLYLAGVLDLYSRRLNGWAMRSSLETALPLAALHMALRRRRSGAVLLHHSDRGCRYASAAYRSSLDEHGCIASMSRRGNC
jgi:transposase InsO family protein